MLPTDNLSLLLAEIITVLDRHTILLQRLNNVASQAMVKLQKQLDHCHELRQQCVLIESGSVRVSSQPLNAGTEVLERLQAQDKIKGELLLVLHQLRELM